MNKENFINRRVNILMQSIPERENEYVFTPFSVQGIIVRMVNTNIENQIRFIVLLDKKIDGKGVDLENYKNVEYLYIVLDISYGDEIDKLVNNDSVFCIVEYFNDKIDENNQNLNRTDGVITISAKINFIE